MSNTRKFMFALLAGAVFLAPVADAYARSGSSGGGGGRSGSVGVSRTATPSNNYARPPAPTPAPAQNYVKPAPPPAAPAAPAAIAPAPAAPTPSYTRAAPPPSTASMGVGAAAVGVGVATTTPAQSSTNSYGGKPAAPTPGTVTARPVDSTSDSKITAAKNAQAVAALKAKQNEFKAPPQPVKLADARKNPVVGTTPTYRTYGEYESRRADIWRERNYTPPSYIHVYSPNYGVYDTSMLSMMLAQAATNAAYASFFHNHQNDASIQAFLNESRRNAATEADLQRQINSLEQKLNEQKGQPINNSYVPDDVKGLVATPTLTVAELNEDEGSSWWIWLILIGGIGGGAYYFLRRANT